MPTMYEMLSERFAEEAHRTLNKSGAKLTYIPQAEVVTRLNRVFGVDKWSMEIVQAYRDAADPDWVIAKVRLVATIAHADGVATVVREGVGGQKIKRMKSGEPVDLGDEFKGAVSDALKKAATLFGIGLYLARDEDAIEAEEEAAANREPAVDPVVRQAYDAVSAVIRTLDKDQKEAIKAAWAERRGDLKFTPENATLEDIKAIGALCELSALSA